MNIKRKLLSLPPKITSRVIAALLALFITFSVFKCVDLITRTGGDDKNNEADQSGENENKDTSSDKEASVTPNENAVVIKKDNVLSITYGVNGESGVLYNITKNELVAEKNMDYRLGVGELSDFMAAIVLADMLSSGDLKENETVVCPAMAAKRPKYELSSDVYSVGERLDVITLIKCLLYQRGSSYTYALAVHSMQSEEQFVDRMNEKAKELGAVSTVFTNVCGQDDGNAKTTAYDTAVILKAFFERDILKEIFESNQPVIIRKKGSNSSVYLTVTNDFFELNCTENQAKQDGIIGGKSGECGYLNWCVVMFDDGVDRYISVSLASPSAFEDSMFIYTRRSGSAS